jgi:hypothetical protein
MPEIKVLNKYRDAKEIDMCSVNIYHEVIDVMRPNLLGNPFSMKSGNDAERDRVVSAFKSYLWDNMKKNTEIGQMIDRLAKCDKVIVLVCCCAPKSCHGDIIKAAIEWKRSH